MLVLTWCRVGLFEVSLRLVWLKDGMGFALA